MRQVRVERGVGMSKALRTVLVWATAGAVIGLSLTPTSSGSEALVFLLGVVGALIGALLEVRLEIKRAISDNK